jgi:UDP:flavonoid glycosyltransferase YjiC (YdhE family)
MIAPLFLDQFYWGYRVKQLGIGPGTVDIRRTSYGRLEKMVLDLVANEAYKKNAAALGERVRSERGVEAFCRHIESYDAPEAARRMDA